MNSAVVSLANWLRRKPLLGRLALKCLPDMQRTIELPTIGTFRIRFRRHRMFWLRDPFTHELTTFGYLQRLVRPGDVCYDVGANIGLYTRALVSGFKPGIVVSFEPMTENLELLRQNIALAPEAAKIRLVETALSDTDGQELLQVDDIMSGSATLDRVAGGRPATGREQYGLGPKTETVRVAKLDTLIERESLPPPDVIKIDIEGGEHLMLSGAVETLRRFRPRLAIEMHRLDVTRRVLALLADLGYHTFAHIRDQGKMTYREIHPSDVDGRTDFYDIHHVVASMDQSLLQEPIPPFSGF